MSAAVNLLQKMGAKVALCLVVIELKGLRGREKLDAPLESLLEY
jgi:adenine phosphoribosyltransferase